MVIFLQEKDSLSLKYLKKIFLNIQPLFKLDISHVTVLYVYVW